ncbi:hypothetical protein [Pseudomonas oryzihabitans]|uniref:hypothetical protein n=1 Tax=Pseudomonas oryzihabitans TaxID=47885 RepID=UPI001115A9C8|nr:hypothetical protein [Pseudomonas psychrotolerans]
MKNFLVLDKSFLQAVPKRRVDELNNSYKLLIPEVMLYELVKGAPEDRANWFSRLPSTDRPFELSRNLGYYLRYEKENLLSCGLPSLHVRTIDHSATKNYRNPEYSIPPDLSLLRYNRKNQVDEDVNSLFLLTKSIGEILPETKGIPPKDRKKAQEYLEEKIASDEIFLKDAVNKIMPHTHPENSEVNKSWISYRWLQVNLLFALDYWTRYTQEIDLTTETKQLERFRHDALDAGYLIIGLQEGAFATKEKKLIRWWNRILPKGVLIQG